MLSLWFARLGLLRKVFVDQVCARNVTARQQRDTIQCEIKNLPVFAPPPHGLMQRVSGEDLRNQLLGIRGRIIGYPHAADINRGKLISVVLEESLERGICQFDRALPAKNYDP